MTVAGSAAALTKAINDATKELDITEASLDAKVTAVQASEAAAGADKTEAEGYREEAAAHAVSVARDLTTVQGNVTFEGVSAILAEKAVTAVDVFVYDTSLDSDGGAWRKRCQHTSWYNEELNTATRGARREFPSVAVIVTDTNRVTIYDGDDPSLPMWMVFEQNVDEGSSWSSPVPMIGASYYDITCISALNAELILGSRRDNEDTTPAYGLFRVRLLADEGLAHSYTREWRYKGSIAQRNSNEGHSEIGNTRKLISGRMRDAAIVALKDAPIDPATGLPLPTIAAATDFGVSVIKDDGTVVDFQSAVGAAGYVCRHVAFDDAGNLYANHNYIDNQERISTLWYFDASTLRDQTDKSASYTPGNVNFGAFASIVPNLLRSTPNNNTSGHKMGLIQPHKKDEISVAALEFGLSRLALARSSAASSLVAYASSAWSTGWLPGDIKGAFLSDTADTHLVEATPLEDDFLGYADDADLQAAWTLRNPTDTLLTLSSGAARIENNVAIAEWASRQFNTVAGQTYFVTGQRVGAGAGVAPRLLVGPGNYSGSLLQLQFNADGVLSGCFTATGTTTYLTLATNNGNVGAFAIFDNISVKLADPDRSVNNNGLLVKGTITRSPVADGAEMVGYAGGGSNYLSRDFAGAYTGHSSFTLIGWYFGGAAGFWDWHETIGGGSSAAHLDTYMDPTSKNFRLVWQNRTSIILQGDGPSVEGRWVQIALCFTGSGGLQFYQDGRLIKAYTSVPSAALHELRVLPAGGSMMALFRLTETIPTADQIAKIYEDERKLFMPGAACTLYGTSDAVTALAHDPKTNLLHVGTSQGRSVFEGLQRVANTETPVGTAISAVNGLIVEE